MRTILVTLFTFCVAAGCSKPAKVELVQSNKQIDVMINDKLVTSYMYKSDLTKPALYPVKTLAGITLTRGFPFQDIEGESKDHPHHFGIFFTYDIDDENKFWNSSKIPPQIKHANFNEIKSGGQESVLSVTLYWIAVSGDTLLKEDRTMTFCPAGNHYTIDFDITLTALKQKVIFNPTKEGMFAIRVADWLTEKSGSGRYLSSNGDEMEKGVWGKRAGWIRLQGEKDGRKLGVVIMDHPGSTNAPTFWHARGYGLFSANPLGQSVFEKSRNVENPEPYTLTLEPGKSAPFKFRTIVYDGEMEKDVLDQQFEAYTK